MVDLSSFVKDALHEALVDTVHDSLAYDGPKLVTEIIIANTIAIANFSNLDCRKHAAGPELVIYGLVIVVVCICRAYLVRFDASHVAWCRVVDHID